MKIPTFRIRLAGLCVPALLSAAAHAQSLPPIDAGKALQENKPALPPVEKKAPEPVIEQSEPPPLTLPANQTLTVNAFHFEGAEFIPEAELQAAVASYKGRALSMTDIQAAADRITVLNYGRKLAEGTPAEIRRHPEVITAYLGKREKRERPRAASPSPELAHAAH